MKVLLNKEMLSNFQNVCRKYCSLKENPGIKYDVAVIGAGIIGTCIARKLQLSNYKVHLIEKECSVAMHQSGHNSGVMHCGIYYPSESLKAKFCVKGIKLLKTYCDEHKIVYNKRGKLIISTNETEDEILNELLKRAKENMVDVKLLCSLKEIREIESGCSGSRAIFCTETANVDFKEITNSFLKDFKEVDGKATFNAQITNLISSDDCQYPVKLILKNHPSIICKYAIICAGLHSGYFSNIFNHSNMKYISMKVDYHRIKPKYCNCLATNVYGVPNLDSPFLGAHFSPTNDDSILLGPYVVPALKVDGYNNEEININYMSSIVASENFQNMLKRNFSQCICQASKWICKNNQIKDLQKLMPNISYQYIEDGPSAVQCQLLEKNGKFVDDFIFDFFPSHDLGGNIINLMFTPSPAATSCLAIADYVVEKLFEIKIK